MSRPACCSTCFSDHYFCFFFQAGQGKKGPDKAVFVEILTSRNFTQLRATLDAYKTVSIDDYSDANRSALWSFRPDFHNTDICFLHLIYSTVSEVFKIIRKSSYC